MAKIKQILAREILDSKGNPTIECTVILNDNSTATAACPSGTSVGTYEAVELRDKDTRRFNGLGVLTAIKNIHDFIAPKLVGMDASNQATVDKIMIELDGTQNKSKLGANAMLSVSMAVCKAAAKSSVLPLFLYLKQFLQNSTASLKIPTPAFNILNGGLHANSGIDFQEFLIIPASSLALSDSIQLGSIMYNSLKKTLVQHNLPTLVGDEGGFGPSLATNIDAFSMLKQAVDSTSYRYGFDVFFGLDAASNNFHKDQQYFLKDRSMPYSSNDFITYYKDLNKQYPLLYLEDPLSEDDWEGWTQITQDLSQNVVIVGDDLTATNSYRLQMALSKKSITGIIIKPNQIGTVIETLAVVEVARQAGLKIIVSHRSGETTDDFIADFSVAVSADYAKFGAPARGERVAKYNRLLQIENQLKTLDSS